MKRFFLVLLVFIFLPCFNVYSQTLITAPILEGIVTASGIEQYLYFGQQLLDNVTQIANFVTMIENLGEQCKMAAQNLASARDISSWDDFMEWSNRQLYLEQQAISAFDSMTVTVGNKSYRLTDVYGIADGFTDTYVDYWNREFTEDQRREMWTNLGLTPSNYAYVQSFKAKAEALVKQDLTAPAIQNEWYVRNMQKNEARQKKLAEDQLKDDDDKMGAKEALMMIAESLIETNKVVNDLSMFMANKLEKEAVESALNVAPADSPPLSDWNGNVFGAF